MNRQESQVQQYFDEIAGGYAKRYHSGNPYHRYFFNERLHIAVNGVELEGKNILDIGAGTGALYDYLVETTRASQYFACDISSEMLEQSKIPTTQRFTGKATAIDFPVNEFDLIFMLGVSSYMSKNECSLTLDFIRQRLSPKGIAIVSFTHRCSLDFQIRRLFRLGVPKGKSVKSSSANRVIGQAFSITAYSLKEIRMMEGGGLKIHRLEWLNQTFSPFNHLLPRLSVALARLLKKHLPSFFLPLFSADFLLVFEIKPSTV